MNRFLIGLSLVVLHTSSVVAQQQYPYQDMSLSFDSRAKDLVSRLTLEEKISQMGHESPAIERLAIPAYNWWNEAAHGVARFGKATVFPQVIGLAATFDKDLIYRIASAVSDEGRAKFHAAQKNGNHAQYSGITFYTPNVNIYRDPRWGRGQETYGEDPYLTAELGLNYVRGLQGDHDKYLKTAACAKHYVVHSGPEALRHEFNAVASVQDMYQTYLPAFETLVKEGNVESVMCAYNATNGIPCCQNIDLLVDLLRGEWGFSGFVTSDCWALSNSHNKLNYTKNGKESAARAVMAEVNLNCGDLYQHILGEVVKEGLIEEKDIDRLLERLFETRFKLGLFDSVDGNPYARISEEVIGCEKHRALAYDAAVRSIVLMTNKAETLPLKKDVKNIYLTGPTASSIESLIGNYNGYSDRFVTFLEGIVGKTAPGIALQYRQGILLDKPNLNPIDWATSEASKADAVICCVGITGVLEGEEGEAIASAQFGDMVDNSLPVHQIEFVKKLKNELGDKPLIIVVSGGTPLDIREITDVADAVLYTWYSGQEGGNALADIIWGNVSPSGKLPVTFVKNPNQDLPAYGDYSMQGRTYRYFEKEPLFPFGHGLSYTTFSYSNIKHPEVIKAGRPIVLSFEVENTGTMEAEEVIQLYLTDEKASVNTPIRQLVAFERVSLTPGERKTIQLTVRPEQMAVCLESGEKIIEQGVFRLSVGGGQPGYDGSNTVGSVFKVKGSKTI